MAGEEGECDAEAVAEGLARAMAVVEGEGEGEAGVEKEGAAEAEAEGEGAATKVRRTVGEALGGSVTVAPTEPVGGGVCEAEAAAVTTAGAVEDGVGV